MDILGLDVDMVEELGVYAIVAALAVSGFDRVELVNAEYCNIFERYLAIAVSVYKLTIKPQRSVACGQSENKRLCYGAGFIYAVALLIVTDALDDFIGNVENSLVFPAENRCGNLFVTVDDVARYCACNQSAIFR